MTLSEGLYVTCVLFRLRVNPSGVPLFYLSRDSDTRDSRALHGIEHIYFYMNVYVSRLRTRVLQSRCCVVYMLSICSEKPTFLRA